MVLAELSKQQLSLEKKSDTNTEISTMTGHIRRLIYNDESCLETVGLNTDLSGITSFSRNSIKNQAGNEIFKISSYDPSASYGNGLLTISSLIFNIINISGTGANQIAEINLRVTFNKTSRAITGHNLAVQNYPLSFELDTNQRVQRCQSNLNSAIDTAYRELCTRMGGTFNPGPPTSCDSPFAQECPNRLISSFDNTGTPVCQTPPSSLSSHPIGRNCYLVAHKQPSADNYEEIPSPGPPTPTPPPATFMPYQLNRYQPDGVTPPSCAGPEYTLVIFNPLRTTPSPPAPLVRHASNPDYTHMKLYCCK